jgi:hypothetical protein
MHYKSPNRSSNDNRTYKFLKYLATSWQSGKRSGSRLSQVLQ